MGSKKKISISWSGGKDSAFALYKIISSGAYDIVHLHTVISQDTKRVGLHGIRELLIERQAEALGLKLVKLYLPTAGDHAAYEKLMMEFYKKCAAQKIEAIMFGDIFLEDLKVFREKLLHAAKLTALFPLWGINSRQLIDDFLNVGFKTIICSANKVFFTEKQMGKTMNQKFVDSMNPAVDPCGENGEYHTFVYDGPIFSNPIMFQLGEIVERTYNYNTTDAHGKVTTLCTSFWFKELLANY